MLVVMALPADADGAGDDLLSSPEIAKLLLLLLLPLLDSAASIPFKQTESADGNNGGDVCPLVAAVAGGPTGLPLPLDCILLPGGLVIMDATEAGMDSPVVWFMYVTTLLSSSRAFACIMM